MFQFPLFGFKGSKIPETFLNYPEPITGISNSNFQINLKSLIDIRRSKFLSKFPLSPFPSFQVSTRPACRDLKGHSGAAPLSRPNSETSIGWVEGRDGDGISPCASLSIWNRVLIIWWLVHDLSNPNFQNTNSKQITMF